MKNFILAALFVSMAAPKWGNAVEGDRIVGKWISNEDKNLVVQIYQSGSEYKAKVLWFDDSDDKARPMADRCDFRNPDKNLRSRKIIGLVVLEGLIYNADENQWQDGRVYDPSSGKEYCAKAWIAEDGTLKVRAYWHFEMLGKNISFTKVS